MDYSDAGFGDDGRCDQLQQLQPIALMKNCMIGQTPGVPPIFHLSRQIAQHQHFARCNVLRQRTVPGERNQQDIMRRHMIYQRLPNTSAVFSAEVRLATG